MKIMSQRSRGAHMRLNTHQICIIRDSNRPIPGLGTGSLFFKKDWILTAKHVVIEDGMPRENLVVSFSNDPISYPVRVSAIHVEIDIAILSIEDSPCNFPLFPGYENLNSASQMICMGYTPSRGETINATAVRNYEIGERERTTTETILEFNSNQYEGGSSGGPIFGNGGGIIGVLINLSETLENGKKLVRATSVLNLVEQINIAFTEGGQIQKFD